MGARRSHLLLLVQTFLKLKVELKSPVSFQGVLHNSSKKKDGVNVALTSDAGVKILDLSFIRELNEGEVKKLHGYKEQQTAIASMVDKVVDALTAAADKDIKEFKANAPAAEISVITNPNNDAVQSSGVQVSNPESSQ